LSANSDLSKHITRLPRRKQRTFGVYKLAVTAASVFMLLLIVVICFQFVQKHRYQQLFKQNQILIIEYEARSLSAQQEINKLNEMSYIEQQARKYLRLVKPGETVFLLED